MGTLTVDQANARLAALYAADESVRVRPVDGRWRLNTEDTVELRSVVFGPPEITAGSDLSRWTDVKVTLRVVSGVAILRSPGPGKTEIITKVWVFSGATTELMNGAVDLQPSKSSSEVPVLDLNRGSWSWSLLDAEGANMFLGLGFRDHLFENPPVPYDLGATPAATGSQIPPAASAPVAITTVFTATSPSGQIPVRASATPGAAPTWALDGKGELSADGQSALYTAPPKDEHQDYNHTVITARVGDTTARTLALSCRRDPNAAVSDPGSADPASGRWPLKLSFVVEGDDGDELFEKKGSEVEWSLTGPGTLTADGEYTMPAEVAEPSIAFITGTYKLAGILTFRGYHVVVLTP